jgi:hypothetical protein
MNQNISLEDWIAECMRLRKENTYLKKQIARVLSPSMDKSSSMSAITFRHLRLNEF